MNELMVPGDYTALGIINIRSQMKTMPSSNLVGAYYNGVPFRVYQVYNEIDGIVWGRVSSNTGEGKARYVALRVNSSEKAKLEKAFEENSSGDMLVDAILELSRSIRELSKNRS